MTIQDIKNISGQDLRTMSTDQLQRLVQTTAMHVNGRMKQLENANIAHRSLAYQNIVHNGDKLTSKGKNRQELMREFKRGQKYLKSKTGTVMGTRQYLANIYNAATGEKVDISKRKEAYKINEKFTEMESKIDGWSMWDIIKKAREDEFTYTQFTSNQLIQMTYDIMMDEGRRMYTWEDFVNMAATQIIKKSREGGTIDGIPYTTEESLIRRI